MTKALPHQLAANVHSSLWVSAHAGTGKTYVLITRLVALLLIGVPARKILCLTYMRAAATEMRERLLDVLAQWEGLPDDALDTEIANRLGWTPDAPMRQRARILYGYILEHMQDLRIQTIHSFCQDILQRFAVEAQVPPHFRLEDALATMAHRQTMIAHYMIGQTQSADFARISRQMKENDFQTFVSTFKEHPPTDMRVPKEDVLQQLRARLGVQDTYENIIRSHLQQLDIKDLKSANLNELVRLLEAGQWSQAWLLWSKHHLTTGNELRKRAQPGAQPTVFSKVFSRAAAALTYDLSAALTGFVEEQSIALRQSKQQRGVLDYDDLIAYSCALLRHSPIAAWVQYKLDEGIDHILLDEAQDTNPAQWEIVQALTEEFFAGAGRRDPDTALPAPSLFVVGDAKQSIVSFQGADIGHYHAVRAQYLAKPANLKDVALVESRRSGATILGIVDRIFAAPHARQSLVGAAELVHKTARDSDSYVEIWAPFGGERTKQGSPPATSPAQRLAEAVAGKVKLLCAQGAATPGDIMILLRQRNPLMPLLQRALLQHGIASSGPDRMVLHTELAIQDVTALMEAALLAQNNLVLANFLRSPLGGASDADLMALAQKAQKANTPWAPVLLRARTGALQHAADRLRWAQAHIDRLPPYEFLVRLLDEQGGLDDLLGRLGNNCLAPIEELLEAALQYEQERVPSAQGFLHWLRSGALECKNEMEQRGAEVRIMTIHSAKGLEAPIVFLPDICRPGNPRQALWQRGMDGEMIWRLARAQKGEGQLVPDYLQQIDMAAQKAEEEESARLLYVALTRARDALYIGGRMARGQHTIPPHSWYGWIKDALNIEAPDARDIQEVEVLAHYGKAPAPADRQSAASAEPVPQRLPRWAQTPVRKEAAPPAPLLAVTALWGDSAHSPAAMLPERAQHFWRGRHLHFLLEHLPRLPQAKRAARGRAWLAHNMPDCAPTDRDILLQEVLDMLDIAALQPFFAPEARTEIPVIGRLQRHQKTVAVQGRIDVMVDTPARVLLGDYKTDRAPPTELAAVPQALFVQMASYARLLAPQYPDKPIECWLIWSKTATAMQLPQNLLDAHWEK